jgi:hypothetical protein
MLSLGRIDSPDQSVQTRLIVLLEQINPDRVETALESFSLEAVRIHPSTEPVTAMRGPPEVLASGSYEELDRSTAVDAVLNRLFPLLYGDLEHETPKRRYALRPGVGVERFSLDIPGF